MSPVVRARELAVRYPAAAEVLDYFVTVLYPAREETYALPPAEIRPGMPPTCPRCGELPVVGILRQDEHSARKSFLCSACAYEWNYHRILCPKCGEGNFEKLPVFIAEQFPHLRVDACDSCNTYLLSVDLTKEPQAVPEVDEIAAIALNYWAQERGYTKLQPNIFGI